MTVPQTFLFAKENIQFLNSSTGQFLLSKKEVKLRKQNFLLVNMLPIKWSYFIENKYFNADFADFPGLDEQYSITSDSADTPIYSEAGNFLFSIQLKEGKQFVSYDFITIFFRLAAVFLLLLFIHAISKDLIEQVNFKIGFLFLLIAVFVLRLFSYLFPFPFDYSKLPLFDPSIYASNFLHPSLGDLFLNAFLFYWVTRFVKNNYTIKLTLCQVLYQYAYTYHGNQILGKYRSLPQGLHSKCHLCYLQIQLGVIWVVWTRYQTDQCLP
jgi:hypothetical protein